jgi:DNA-binding SARP family transcriptional activator/predicted ATPase
MLQLQLLGHFQLLVNGEPVRMQQPRLQSLLAYLLLHRHSSQTRQHLAFLFWPDTSEAQAHANLRKALYDLRRLIPDLDQYLRVECQDPERATIHLDVTAFEERLAQATANGAPSADPAALEQAVALYTGDLLPACYNDWVLHERERLRQLYLHGLEQLVYLLEERRAYDAAVVHAQQLLHADALRESTYRTLMRLHLQNGDRARALRVYHTCTTVLQQELGVEPGPETQAAYRRLLNREAMTTLPSATKGNLTLVGRQREWDALLHGWRSACQGQSHFVLIAGEAGIGKTRLAEELLQWAERQGYAAARTRSYVAEGQLAYAPVAEWLRAEGVRTPLARLERVWLSEVARLLPELLAERPDLAPPQPLTDSWQRQRFREALARAFMVGEQPLLLVIDDLQWCDRETLEWLHYLLRFADAARLLVVGTVRPEELGPEHPLLALLLDLRQAGKLLDLELGPLDATETAALAALVASRALDADQAAALYAETEGHPLFVVEMMRARDANTGGPLPAPSSATSLPPKVQAIISSRLLQLSRATRELAGLAAIVGRAFTAEVLAQAHPEDTRGDADALVQGLDELWQRRIIREQAANAYDFSHDKLREAAYASISPARRRLFHGRVAQALERINAADLDAMSGQIATHYEHAGLPHEAVAYYQRAGEVAQRIYAHADAASNLTRGIALLEHLPATPERLRQELTLQLALGISVTTMKGRSAPEGKTIYVQAHELALQLGDDPKRLAALTGLIDSFLTRGQIVAGYELIKQGLALAERIGDPSGLVEAYGRLGVAEAHRGQWQASRGIFEQILAQTEYRWDSSSYRIWAQHQGLLVRRYLAHVLWHMGHPDQSQARMNEALALAQALDHRFSQALVLCWSAWLYQLRREPALALAQVEKAILLASQQGFRYLLGQCIVVEGWALAQQEQIEAGIARMHEGLAVRLAADGKIHRPGFLAMLAETYGEAAQPEQGLRLLDEALAQVESTGECMSEAELHRLKGVLLQMQRVDEQEVESHFLRALAIARQQEAKSLELRATMSLSRLWQQQGKRQQARDLLAEVYGWFREGFNTPDLQEALALLKDLS